VTYAGGKLVYSNDLGVTWKDSPLTIPSDILGQPLSNSDAKESFYVLYTSAPAHLPPFHR